MIKLNVTYKRRTSETFIHRKYKFENDHRKNYVSRLSPPDNAEICNKFIAVERSKMITIVLMK